MQRLTILGRLTSVAAAAMLGFACASGGGGAPAAPGSDTIRVPLRVQNLSTERLQLQISGRAGEWGEVSAGGTACFLLPPRIDNEEILLRGVTGGGTLRVGRQAWSTEPGWTVEIPRNIVSTRMLAFPSQPCVPR